eukprot:TRINITY_DN9951_c0_g1_i1.p1 TRINITY_DN9951_c0_g1~~TRINITY_DN9951_c0_g1_i1.p1  ORF type:complete len:397 (-),score=40.22 TRINITY_DN9951_c0_g1_i1:1-1191(-)
MQDDTQIRKDSMSGVLRLLLIRGHFLLKGILHNISWTIAIISLPEFSSLLGYSNSFILLCFSGAYLFGHAKIKYNISRMETTEYSMNISWLMIFAQVMKDFLLHLSLTSRLSSFGTKFLILFWIPSLNTVINYQDQRTVARLSADITRWYEAGKRYSHLFLLFFLALIEILKTEQFLQIAGLGTTFLFVIELFLRWVNDQVLVKDEVYHSIRAYDDVEDWAEGFHHIQPQTKSIEQMIVQFQTMIEIFALLFFLALQRYTLTPLRITRMTFDDVSDKTGYFLMMGFHLTLYKGGEDFISSYIPIRLWSKPFTALIVLRCILTISLWHFETWMFSHRAFFLVVYGFTSIFDGSMTRLVFDKARKYYSDDENENSQISSVLSAALYLACFIVAFIDYL